LQDSSFYGLCLGPLVIVYARKNNVHGIPTELAGIRERYSTESILEPSNQAPKLWIFPPDGVGAKDPPSAQGTENTEASDVIFRRESANLQSIGTGAHKDVTPVKRGMAYIGNAPTNIHGVHRITHACTMQCGLGKRGLMQGDKPL
jgi:hypothetical protein